MPTELAKNGKQPPPLPQQTSEAIEDGAPVNSAAVNSNSITSDSIRLPTEHTTEEVESHSVRQLLFGTVANGYYLSLALHVVGYAIAAVLFMWLSDHFVEEDLMGISVRATLDDKDVLDNQPQMEMVQDISMTAPKGPSQVEQLTHYLQSVENGTIDTTQFDLQSMGAASSEDEGNDLGGDFLFRIPESGLAVTKGSFTAWTDPETPSPGQRYNIIIIIGLPDGVKGYRVSDLKGNVIGSDGFRQKLRYDTTRMSASFYTDENNQLKPVTGSESIKVRNNQVQLVVSIPGAERLTRDVIKISSRRLREEQELELVFGGAKKMEQ